MASVVNSVVLYGAPIWQEALQYKKYRERLEKVQRLMALRVCSAYRTVSTVALQVVGALIPIDLMVEERTTQYQQGEGSAAELRLQTVRQWQSRWDCEKERAQWTKRLIPSLEPWLGRKHGEVTYHLTQCLTGHGVFGSYLKRIGWRDAEMCWYCRELDMPEHTMFQCARWVTKRTEAETATGVELNAENVVEVMLRGQTEWDAVGRFLTEVMRQKEADERQEEIQKEVSQNPPHTDNSDITNICRL
jgi:hypothetical protein